MDKEISGRFYAEKLQLQPRCHLQDQESAKDQMMSRTTRDVC